MVSGKIHLFFVFFLFLPLVPSSSSVVAQENTSTDLPEEKGLPLISQIECTDTGLCLVFYARPFPNCIDCYDFNRYIKLVDS